MVQGKSYDRRVAHVSCGGRDAGRTQVSRGMAWVSDKYAKDMSLYAVQAEAKAARRGLWADNNPIQPWEWRKKRR